MIAACTFAALDFEIADRRRFSVCAVGLVRVVDGQIVQRYSRLVRPPSSHFSFARLHGITSLDVADSPNFPAVWAEVTKLLVGAQFVAAHHAAFELSVLFATCSRWHLPFPRSRFLCTRHLAERTWGARFARLDRACRHLNIPLVHHDPLSDAEASARIVLEVLGRNATGHVEPEFPGVPARNLLEWLAWSPPPAGD